MGSVHQAETVQGISEQMKQHIYINKIAPCDMRQYLMLRGHFGSRSRAKVTQGS